MRNVEWVLSNERKAVARAVRTILHPLLFVRMAHAPKERAIVLCESRVV